MNDAAVFSARLAECNAPSPFRQDDISASSLNQREGGERVGQDALAEAPMTDEEREQAAFRAGNAMQAWYSQYQLTRNPACLTNAHRCLEMQCKLLAGRSAEFVARLEQERGLA